MSCELIKQKNHRAAAIYKEQDYFVRVCGCSINVSSAVRDSILPHKFVRVFADKEQIVFEPTDDESAYAASCSANMHNQMKITYAAAKKISNLKIGERIPAFVDKSGRIIIKCEVEE